MFVDFRKVFAPTEEEKRQQRETLQNLYKQLIKNQACSTCVNCRFEKAYEHGNSFDETYCNITGVLQIYNGKYRKCDNYVYDGKELNLD